MVVFKLVAFVFCFCLFIFGLLVIISLIFDKEDRDEIKNQKNDSQENRK